MVTRKKKKKKKKKKRSVDLVRADLQEGYKRFFEDYSKRITETKELVERLREPSRTAEEMARQFALPAETFMPFVYRVERLPTTDVMLTAGAFSEISGKILESGSTADFVDLSNSIESVSRTLQIPKATYEDRELIEDTRRVVEEPDAVARLWDYYEALADMELVSLELSEVARTLSKEKKRVAAKDEIRTLTDDIRSKILGIKDWLWAAMTVVGTKVRQAIDDFLGSLGKSLKAVAKAFRDMVNKIYSFGLALIGSMFDFVADIQRIAEEREFALKELSMELQPPSFEIITSGALIFPYPKFRPPKLTIKFLPAT